MPTIQPKLIRNPRYAKAIALPKPPPEGLSASAGACVYPCYTGPHRKSRTLALRKVGKKWRLTSGVRVAVLHSGEGR